MWENALNSISNELDDNLIITGHKVIGLKFVMVIALGTLEIKEMRMLFNFYSKCYLA